MINNIQLRNVYFGAAAPKQEQAQKNNTNAQPVSSLSKDKVSSTQDNSPKIILPPANLSGIKHKDKVIQAIPVITSIASFIVAGIALCKLNNMKISLKSQMNGNFKELSGQVNNNLGRFVENTKFESVTTQLNQKVGQVSSQVNNIIPKTSSQITNKFSGIEKFSEQVKQLEIRQDGFERQLKHCKVEIKGLRNAHEELRSFTDKVADRLKGIFGCLTQNKIFSDKQIRQIFHECK